MTTQASLILAPDVGAIVEYGLNSFGTAPATYRVSSWMRPAVKAELAPGDWIGELLREASREMDPKNGGEKTRMEWCLREEATHVALSGICGAIAPIEQCKVIGRVEWSEERIDEARETAVTMGASRRMLF